MKRAKPPPRIPLNLWGILLRVVVATVVLFAANFARIPFQQLAAERLSEAPNAHLVADASLFFLTAVLVALAVAAWFRVVERTSMSITGLFDLRRIIPGLAGGTGLVAVATLLAWAVLLALGQQLPAVAAADLAGAETDLTALGIGSLVFYLLARAFVLQGLPEELLYRGWLFSLTRNRPWLTLWWTTAAFTVVHLVSAGGQQSVLDHVLYLALPLGMGLLAGAVVLWRGSMWWAVGTHGGMHVCLPVATLLFPMTQGPVLWLSYGVAQVVVGAVVLILWHRRRDS